MPEITEKQLSAKIKENSLCPVCFLWGEEHYASLTYAKRIISTTAGELADFNLTVFDGESVSAQDIIASADTLPLMGARRCVYVNDIPLAKGSLGAEGIQELEAYFENPSGETVLLFRFSKKQTFSDAGFKKLLAAAVKHGDAVEFSRYSEGELAKLLCIKASRNNCTMNTATARYLIASCGDDMSALMCEMDKLSAAKQGREILCEDIDLLCAKSLEARVFDIYNAVADGNADKVFSIIDTLMLMHEEPLRILAAVSSTYTAMYFMKSGLSENITPKEMSAMLKKTKSEKQLAFSQREGAKYSKKCLERCIEILADADYDIKTSAIPARTALERAMVQLICVSRNKKG